MQVCSNAKDRSVISLHIILTVGMQSLLASPHFPAGWVLSERIPESHVQCESLWHWLILLEVSQLEISTVQYRWPAYLLEGDWGYWEAGCIVLIGSVRTAPYPKSGLTEPSALPELQIPFPSLSPHLRWGPENRQNRGKNPKPNLLRRTNQNLSSLQSTWVSSTWGNGGDGIHTQSASISVVTCLCACLCCAMCGLPRLGWHSALSSHHLEEKWFELWDQD